MNVKLKKKLSDNTIRSYIPKIIEFQEFAGVSLSQIKKDAKRANFLGDLEPWRKKLDEFYAKLVNEKKHKKPYALDKLIVVNSFFSSFKVDLEYTYPEIKEEDENGNVIEEEAFVPTVENLRSAFLAKQDRELRAFFLIAKDTGLSEIDILTYDIDYEYHDEKNKVTYDSLRKQYKNRMSRKQDEFEPLFLPIPRTKTGILTRTFMGSEAFHALDLSKDSLFPWTTKGKPESQARKIRRKFELVSNMIDIPDISPKSLRAFYADGIRAVQTNELQAKVMTGHKIPKGDIERHYTNFSRERLLPNYTRAYEFLRLFPEEVMK